MKEAKRSYGEGRTQVISFRVSPHEYEKLQSDAEDAGMSVSTFSRELVMHRSPTPALERNILFTIRKVLAELKKAMALGANSNEVRQAAAVVYDVFKAGLLGK